MKGVSDKSKLDEDFLQVNGNPFSLVLQTSPCHLSTGNLEIKVSLTFNCRFNTFRLDEHQFETRRDRHFNCAGTIAKVDHTMQNFSTHGSPNSVSMLLCNG